jgi:N-acetylmuramoyl-L-alanine amidase
MDRAPMCREDCDLFVSLHVNSFANRGVRGFETYFLDHAQNENAARVAAMENEALRYEASLESGADDELGFIFQDLLRNAYLRESAQLAEFIQRHGSAVHPGGGRYVGQANFAVLRGATRPAVLVEVGYASNRDDGSYLASTAGQRRIAEAIADGILDYLRSYELKTAAAPPQ